jgi:hypothetical protein
MAPDLLTMVAAEIVRLEPPLRVAGSRRCESFDNASVDLEDGAIIWRIMRERAILHLLAAPTIDTTQWFDADLLGQLTGQPTSRPPQSTKLLGGLPYPVSRSITDLIDDVRALRPSLAAMFDPPIWPETRRQLRQALPSMFWPGLRIPEP